MFRLPMTLVAVAAAVLVAAQAALAVNVKIRVEGRTQTIYGAVQPTVGADNALAALEAASSAGEFYYHVATFSFGSFVDQIGRYKAEGSNGWAFKVNGASPTVGADQVDLKDGDVVLWYWATFGPNGGPQTLVLRRTSRNCYAVSSQDDTGRSSPATGSSLVFDGKRRSTRAGRACIGRHRGLVRATRAGAVRSNALP